VVVEEDPAMCGKNAPGSKAVEAELGLQAKRKESRTVLIV
jgi:hypothetical protein